MMKHCTQFLLAIMFTTVAAYGQPSLQQQLSVLRNDAAVNGTFSVGVFVKGTGLTGAATLASFTIDIVYDRSCLRYVNASAWAFGLADGYNRFATNSSEFLRVGGTGGGVNQDGGGLPAGFDVSADYRQIVQLNFTILAAAPHATFTINPVTNQFGLFNQPANEPNTGSITNQLLTAPVVLTDVPLPVELADFTASAKGGSVLLQWKTSSEVDNYGFELERLAASPNGQEAKWQKLGFVQGAGTSNAPHSYAFTDRGVTTDGDVAVYRLKQIDRSGQCSLSKELHVRIEQPRAFALGQNYPNPFNPSTKIGFELPMAGVVALSVFNILGEKVADVVHAAYPAGRHTAEFRAAGLPSGTYFYRLSVNGTVMTRSMHLLK